jgi:integrase
LHLSIFQKEDQMLAENQRQGTRERWLKDLRQKVARLNTKTKSILFSDLAQRWLAAVGSNLKSSSLLRRETAIHGLAPYFTNTVRSISKTQVEGWASHRAKLRAARTCNIERETLIQILDYAVRERLTLENPAHVIPRRKQPKPQIIIPSKSQFKTLVEQIRQRDVRATEAANLCELLGYSGCRLAEATAMQWGDVNFELNSFVVTGGETGTKNHEARTVPLFAPLERLLLTMRDALPQPSQPTNKISSIISAKKAIASACKKANLPHFTHHSLRHFFCSNAIEAGIDFKVIAGWLGHKDGGVFVANTYGHLRDEHSAAVAKRMTFDASTEGNPVTI